MGNQKVFNFDMVHDVERQLMVQIMEPFRVVTDWESGTIKIMKVNTVIEPVIDFKNNEFSLYDYAILLKKVEKYANELNQFSHD